MLRSFSSLTRLTTLAAHQQASLSLTEVSHQSIGRIPSKCYMAVALPVFLSHYLTIWPDATSILPQVGTVSTVSTLQSYVDSPDTDLDIASPQGIMYLFLPPLALLLAKNPHLRPASMWLGTLICTSGILASGFTTHPWQLLITQGVMYAVGGSESNLPVCEVYPQLIACPRPSLPLLPCHFIHVSPLRQGIINDRLNPNMSSNLGSNGGRNVEGWLQVSYSPAQVSLGPVIHVNAKANRQLVPSHRPRRSNSPLHRLGSPGDLRKTCHLHLLLHRLRHTPRSHHPLHPTSPSFDPTTHRSRHSTRTGANRLGVSTRSSVLAAGVWGRFARTGRFRAGHLFAM